MDAATEQRFDAIDERLVAIEERLVASEGRAYVHDRAIFGGPSESGDRVVSLYEQLKDTTRRATAAAESAAAASVGVASMRHTWEQFPNLVLKYAVRFLWGLFIVVCTVVGFMFVHWDKIARTIELWRHS